MPRRVIVAVLFGCATLSLGGRVALAQPSTYAVRDGDSLWGIAHRFGIDTASLIHFNHLTHPDALQPGQILRLTPLAVRSKHGADDTSIRGSRMAGTHTVARHQARPRSRDNPVARLAVAQALFAALHTGVAAPKPPGTPSFTFAERLVALEVRLTDTALRYLGVPYAWGGESFTGVDCSGFVQAVFRRNGIALPRTADAQFSFGRHVTQDALRPGDLVFFETYAPGASHVGIYLGGGRFVHASASQGVRIDSLSDGYYAARYIGARRYIGT